MKTLMLCLALAASLSACVSSPGAGNNTADNSTVTAPEPVTTRILADIDRAEAA